MRKTIIRSIFIRTQVGISKSCLLVWVVVIFDWRLIDVLLIDFGGRLLYGIFEQSDVIQSSERPELERCDLLNISATVTRFLVAN